MNAATPPDADPMLVHLAQTLAQEDGRWRARQGSWLLDSHFQPVFSFPHRRAVGYEALLRVTAADGQAVSPLHFFEQLQSFEAQWAADRLCRLLHVNNFVHQAGDIGWLFLNIHPAVFVHGAMQTQALDASVRTVQALGLPMHRLVLEVTEDVMAQETDFQQAVSAVRQTGCLLALDDFGAGHSNFDRIWHIHPEIVKLDRSLLRRACGSPRIARVLAQMVSLLHECGSLVLLEGVETRDEALLALTRAAGREDVGIVNDVLRDFASAYPDSRLIPDAMFRRARICIELLGDGATGMRLLSAIDTGYPEFAAGDAVQRYRQRLKIA